jgi:lambda family phage tail tape measure protein
MSIIARLGAVLGLDTKEFVKGVDAAQQKSKEFKKNLKDLQNTTEGIKTAFAAASAAFIGFAGYAIHAADEIQDLADANEVTTGKILELKGALQLSGGDAGKIDVLFTKFTGAINEAAQGSDKLRDSFKQLGISTRDIGFLTNTQLLDKSFSGLSKIQDVTTRNALAMDLFGKAAKSVDFTQMSQNAEKLSGKYKDQEAAIKASADAMEKFETLVKNIQMAAMLAVKPVLDLFNKIPSESKIDAMTKAFQALGIAMGIAFGVSAVNGIIKFGTALSIVKASNPWLSALGLIGAAVATFGAADAFLGSGINNDGDVSSESSNDKNNKKRSIELSARDKMLLKYEQEIKALKDQYILKKEILDLDVEQEKRILNLEGKKFELSTNEYNRSKLLFQLSEEMLQKEKSYITELANARKEMERAPPEEQAYAKKLYDEKVKLLNDYADLETEKDKQINEIRIKNFDAEYERQKSWAAGWDEAFKRYTEAAERSSDRGKEAFQMVVSNMEMALKNFVETGKLNFKDLIGTIIKQLIVAQLVAQSTGLFKMGVNAIFGGNSTSGGGGMGSFASLLMSGVGKASGGYIDRPTLVGENGAELFIPRTSGTVIPNGSWQGMAAMGGGGLTVNGTYIANMSAIDTQSATQFLVSNKNTIWASYQSANRSVPISR